MTKRQIYTIAILLLCLLAIASMVLGYSRLGLGDLLAAIIGKGSPAHQLIVWNIRLPRLLVSLLAGASLAISGHLFQTLTRNPLADSGVLGVNAGAGLALTLALTWQMTSLFYQPILALGGGLVATGLVYLLAYKKGQALRPVRLILTGVGLTSLFSSSMVTLMVRFDPYKLETIVSWLSGRYVGADWQTISLVAPLLINLGFLSLYKAHHLNILQLAPALGTSLGLDQKKTSLHILLLATGLASLSSLLVGNTAFVGLLAGHLAKQVTGRQHQESLPLAAIIGSCLMLLSDLLARLLLVGTGIPTGLVLTVIGTPYFLWLLSNEG